MTEDTKTEEFLAEEQLQDITGGMCLACVPDMDEAVRLAKVGQHLREKAKTLTPGSREAVGANRWADKKLQQAVDKAEEVYSRPCILGVQGRGGR